MEMIAMYLHNRQYQVSAPHLCIFRCAVQLLIQFFTAIHCGDDDLCQLQREEIGLTGPRGLWGMKERR